MSDRLLRLEEMIRATERALASLREEGTERIEAAVRECSQALEASLCAGDPDFRGVADLAERAQLQEAIARLRDLTHHCLQEVARARAEVSKNLQRSTEVRHFIDATRLAGTVKESQLDQEG